VVSGWRALARKINPLAQKVDAPGPLKTIMRAKELGGRRAELAELDARPPDILVHVTSDTVDMLDFRSDVPLIDVGYEQALTQLAGVMR
jgi:predicted acylesterase/phospholipase RssA